MRGLSRGSQLDNAAIEELHRTAFAPGLSHLLVKNVTVAFASTFTHRRIFDDVEILKGAALAHVRDTTNGSRVDISESGLYWIQYCENYSSQNTSWAVVRNGTDNANGESYLGIDQGGPSGRAVCWGRGVARHSDGAVWGPGLDATRMTTLDAGEFLHFHAVNGAHGTNSTGQIFVEIIQLARF